MSDQAAGTTVNQVDDASVADFDYSRADIEALVVIAMNQNDLRIADYNTGTSMDEHITVSSFLNKLLSKLAAPLNALLSKLGISGEWVGKLLVVGGVGLVASLIIKVLFSRGPKVKVKLS